MKGGDPFFMSNPIDSICKNLKNVIYYKRYIIKGPVANDNTMRTIALYISGIYTTEQAIAQLKFFKVNDQVSFHTEKAL